MAWASEADVLAITGQTVTATDVARATVLVEIHIGRRQDDIPTPPGRDGYFLKLAVAFQAAAIAAGVDSSQDEIVSMAIDGLSVTVKESSDNPSDLVPLANRAANQLSWMRGGSVKVGIGRLEGREWTHEVIEWDDRPPWTQWRPL